MEDMDGIFARGWMFPGMASKVTARSRTLERRDSMKTMKSVVAVAEMGDAWIDELGISRGIVVDGKEESFEETIDKDVV